MRPQRPRDPPRAREAGLAACVDALDRLTRALARVEALTVGGSWPSYVTSAAGEEAYAELGERIEVGARAGSSLRFHRAAAVKRGGNGEGLMRIIFLFLSLMLVAASAQADLRDPAWIRTASGSAAQALIRGGADVNRVCNANRNRPLHQTILNPDSSPDLLRALLDAGANPEHAGTPTGRCG